MAFSNVFTPTTPGHQRTVWWLFAGLLCLSLIALARSATARLIHTKDDTTDKLDAAGMTLAYQAVLQLVRQLDAKLP